MSSPVAPAGLRHLPGELVAGRYRVGPCVGVGGMAAVFAGEHTTLQQTMAIKILRPELHRSGEVVARFDREARIASTLEHPHVIQVFDCGISEQGLRYMVMPLLEGTELSKTLSAPLVASQAVALMRQVFEAIGYVHRCGIVHRDVKPENLFVVHDVHDREVIKLVDFGVAKSIAGRSDQFPALTRAGLIVGTPSHMSPEQVMGLDVDERTDLYAAGVTFYELVAGRLPFEDLDPNEMLRRHVRDEPAPLPAHVPAALRAIVMRLLAKKPSDRYRDAAAVLPDLDAVARQLSTDPRPWRRLLGEPTRDAPRPATLGGDTVVWMVREPTFSGMSEAGPAANVPPSENSGVQPFSSLEECGEPEPAVDPMSQALEHVLEATGDASSLLSDLRRFPTPPPIEPAPRVRPRMSSAPIPSTALGRETQHGPFESLVPDFAIPGEGTDA